MHLSVYVLRRKRKGWNTEAWVIYSLRSRREETRPLKAGMLSSRSRSCPPTQKVPSVALTAFSPLASVSFLILPSRTSQATSNEQSRSATRRRRVTEMSRLMSRERFGPDSVPRAQTACCLPSFQLSTAEVGAMTPGMQRLAHVRVPRVWWEAAEVRLRISQQRASRAMAGSHHGLANAAMSFVAHTGCSTRGLHRARRERASEWNPEQGGGGGGGRKRRRDAPRLSVM
ncbi:hypothetical protein LXA43DRAFT_423705 [Ganoderma leucocontextum]|nr:hypothetical protein LXA43DRAFT_423705 [Ganoderma leucocontextum]